MRLHTETGSVYELDTEQKRARRLIGNGDPTPRTGKDGAWREYVRTMGVTVSGAMNLDFKVGDGLLIEWPQNIEPAAVSGASPATLTSRIVRIES